MNLTKIHTVCPSLAFSCTLKHPKHTCIRQDSSSKSDLERRGAADWSFYCSLQSEAHPGEVKSITADKNMSNQLRLVCRLAVSFGTGRERSATIGKNTNNKLTYSL